ncbi:sialate O-acetylesterase [Thalassotalea crassostreae]|uniref:sialate O-acetylesterase n=1 Tax=Thalassotalea crassostreae TaxID=1763536 RepID=UPI0009EEF665|nr:sialate O-acetylesterase [Thalassotalea crassostreae]
MLSKYRCTAKKFILLCLLPLTISVANAEVKLATVFADSMIIQRDMPINIWGTAVADEQVTIILNDKSYLGEADKNGEWLITLPPQKMATQQSIKVLGNNTDKNTGKTNTIELTNVAFGDVYLASGQSNMEYKVKQILKTFPNETKLEQYPDVRQFKVARHYDFQGPLQDIKSGKWLTASSKSVTEFSAVAWFFAKELYQHTQVPIGIISSSVGATPIESWMSVESLANFPKTQALAYNLADDKFIENLKTQYADERAKWWQENPNAKKLEFAVKHRTSLDFKPVGFHNAMIAPLANIKLSGVIWYQGESNTREPSSYADKFTTLINHWRALFSQPQLPFMYVQLANFQKPDEQPSESAWAELRQAQTKVLNTTKHTAMALAIDVGERHDIHPQDKQTVGQRLALSARSLVYGETTLNYLSPMVDDAKVTNGKAIFSFKHINKGLTVDGSTLQGFAIAGADKKFIWANAKLENSGTNNGKVVVWHDCINSPKYVRYAWGNNPENANLYNDQGLPATPFNYELAH